KKAPVGVWGLVLVLGPCLVWCGEYIGSGEVIIATRTGAILGPAVLWAIGLGIFLKYWIGLCGARYAVVTGEGMIDCFARAPGPRNWLVWVVLVGQVASGICAIGALAVAAATFLGSLVPLGRHTTMIWGAAVTAFAFSVAWTGGFRLLKHLMALMVAVIVVGVIYVAAHYLPPVGELLGGLFGFGVPEVPAWAVPAGQSAPSAWTEILPLIGWSAGGFASQVWYTYWVQGAGYGMAQERSWGMKADEARLGRLSAEEAREVRSWVRVVGWDATTALVIGVVVTSAFLLAGSGVLGGKRLAPTGPDVAIKLSGLFADRWSEAGGVLFLAAGAAAMISTQLGQFAGWPRLLADCVRNVYPPFGRRKPTTQFRLFLCLFLLTNLVILALFGTSPVFLVKFGSICDGLLLVPLQALAVGYGLFFAQRKLLSPEAWQVLRPGWHHAAVLLIAFLVFGYFCIFQVPQVLAQMFGR
ncbi:MAG TPA: Nramp family divalent metal transporter, partial [Phycisphaerae bacterium]|nr:Nramp family divalent metal transporter [Phycisphaerae bacterium]